MCSVPAWRLLTRLAALACVGAAPAQEGFMGNLLRQSLPSGDVAAKDLYAMNNETIDPNGTCNGTSCEAGGVFPWPPETEVIVLACVVVFIVWIGGAGFYFATQANFKIAGGASDEANPTGEEDYEESNEVELRGQAPQGGRFAGRGR